MRSKGEGPGSPSGGEAGPVPVPGKVRIDQALVNRGLKVRIDQALVNHGLKVRIDQALVNHGLIETREKARRCIMAGQIRVNGQVVSKASTTVREGDRLECQAPEKYVSRGGLKLEGALDAFQLKVEGWSCLDIGASTGGFTDCLLQRGASRVVALDVGHGQLHWKIRQDPRVEVREKVNARDLAPNDFANRFDAVVCDVSFISLRLILPPALRLLRPAGIICALIKPQFEAGRSEVGKGGIVRDPGVHDRVIDGLRAWVKGYPLEEIGLIPSPITGTDGNREFLWCLRRFSTDS